MKKRITSKVLKETNKQTKENKREIEKRKKFLILLVDTYTFKHLPLQSK